MSVQATEEEAIWLGGDDRAAEAITRENDGLHNRQEVADRAELAQHEHTDAA
jgi:hypothetical protein